MRRTMFLLVATGALLLVGNSAYAGDDWRRGPGPRYHHHHGHYQRYYRPAPWIAPPPPRFPVVYGVYPRYGHGFGYRDHCAPRYIGGRGVSISFGF